MQTGEIVSGTITGIRDYGAFVQVEDYCGLIHISEFSDGYVKDIKAIVNVGDVVNVEILEVDEESKKLKEVLEGNLPAISLTSHISLTTAYSNDKEPSAVFAQQLAGLGAKGDTFIAISTSGNSLNCVYACFVAKAKGLKTVALTGAKDSRLSSLSDVCVKVPETETYKIQEYHLPIYHALCAMLEEEFFD